MGSKKYLIKERHEIDEILATNRVGRLATFGVDGYPYITPLNYVFWNDKIYMHCALKGDRMDNLTVNNRVCFEVAEAIAYLDSSFELEPSVCDVTQFYKSVVIKGSIALVTDADLKVVLLNKLIESHEGHADFPPVVVGMKAVAGCHVLELTIEEISGKHNVGKHRGAEYRAAVVKHLPECKHYFE